MAKYIILTHFDRFDMQSKISTLKLLTASHSTKTFVAAASHIDKVDSNIMELCTENGNAASLTYCLMRGWKLQHHIDLMTSAMKGQSSMVLMRDVIWQPFSFFSCSEHTSRQFSTSNLPQVSL